MIPPRQQQSPRGPSNELHHAARHGQAEHTLALLSMGSININQVDPRGFTPLMFAAQAGHSHVARILVKRGANASVASDGGTTALHLSAHNGHLAVTVDLIKAGANLQARVRHGAMPLHLATQNGHSVVMEALIKAGADVDSLLGNGGHPPLYLAAFYGHLDAVKALLRANANPLLITTTRSGDISTPLDAAANYGHSEVVRELIQHDEIESWGRGSGGLIALGRAGQTGHVDIMAMLTDAGVVDTLNILISVAGCGQEASVKFLLQQRQLAESPSGLDEYVNCRDHHGCTALFCAIYGEPDRDGAPHPSSPRVARLLIDAGADASSLVRVTDTPEGEVLFNGTPLAFTNDCLRRKKVGNNNRDATEEQMHRLKAIRRLLLRVDAARAVSWLWVSREPPLVRCAAEVSGRAARKTAASGTQLALMLPPWRRRRRGVLLAPLFRYLSHP